MSHNHLNHIGTPYFQWLNSALYCLATFHRHQFNCNVICVECHSNLPKRDCVYDQVTRYYTIIGGDENCEQCSSCNNIIFYSETAVACAECYEALFDFARHLYNSKNKPYLGSEPTVIKIEKTFTCPCPEE